MNFIKMQPVGNGRTFFIFENKNIKIGIDADLVQNCKEEGETELDADMLHQVKRSNKYLIGVENTKVTDAEAQAVYTAACAL